MPDLPDALVGVEKRRTQVARLERLLGQKLNLSGLNS